jgi:phosphoadenosine phosphosulfate reductase
MSSVHSQAAHNLGHFEGMEAEALLAETIVEKRFGKAVLVSSFGTESAVLLHMVSRLDPGFPIFFLNTNKLFAETLIYNRMVAEKFGLTGIDKLGPDEVAVKSEDPKGDLWQKNPDACCDLRKTRPLDEALKGYDTWITGRKRFQSDTRKDLPAVEFASEHYKVNPLVSWTKNDIDAYFATHDLPRHPLEAQGFPSIGCLPCTDQVADGEDTRAGRWRGQQKTECGIHLSAGSTSSRLPTR